MTQGHLDAPDKTAGSRYIDIRQEDKVPRDIRYRGIQEPKLRLRDDLWEVYMGVKYDGWTKGTLGRWERV